MDWTAYMAKIRLYEDGCYSDRGRELHNLSETLRPVLREIYQQNKDVDFGDLVHFIQDLVQMEMLLKIQREDRWKEVENQLPIVIIHDDGPEPDVDPEEVNKFFLSDPPES